VFSFGCVMLHTLSHQWLTPSETVVADCLEVKGQTEVENTVNTSVEKVAIGVLITLI